MIRKAIIVVLTLGAVGTATLWTSSHICWEDEIYDVGSWTCLIGCRNTGCWIFLEPDRYFKLEFSAGNVSTYYSEDVAAYTSEEHSESRIGVGLFFGLRAYVYHDDEYGTATNVTSIYLPLWLVFTFFATYPTIAFIRGPLHRRRRRRRGQCLGCGYSLEGNVSGVCPECGARL